MVTLYDLLDVNSNSSKEEIEKSYKNLIIEYATNPNLSEEENKENEIIISKLKMAYEILIDDEKRKKYDSTLAKKKAEALLQNVSIKHEEEKKEESKDENIQEEFVEDDEIAKISPASPETENEIYEEENVELSKEEQKKVREAAQKEFKTNCDFNIPDNSAEELTKLMNQKNLIKEIISKLETKYNFLQKGMYFPVLMFHVLL